MCLPRTEATQFFWFLHVVKESQHFAELVHGIGRNAFCVVLCIEPFQALMDDVLEGGVLRLGQYTESRAAFSVRFSELKGDVL
jgi:hypothetical protein